MEDKAAVYAELIRRLMLQYDGVETRLRTADRSKPAAETAENRSATAVTDREVTHVTEEHRYYRTKELYGMTPEEMSAVFERDARRYDDG